MKIYNIIHTFLFVCLFSIAFITYSHSVGELNLEAQSGRTCCNNANVNQCSGCGTDETCSNPPGDHCPPPKILCASGWHSNACCLNDTDGGWGGCECPAGIQRNSCGATRGCTCCSPTNPTAPGMKYPSSGAVLPFNTSNIEFNWTVTDWGVNCTGSRSYSLYLFTGTCTAGNTEPILSSPTMNVPGTWYLMYQNGGSPSKAPISVSLTPGRTYCWGVYKSNGQRAVWATSQFSLAEQVTEVTGANAYCNNGQTFLDIDWTGPNGQDYYIDLDTTSGNPAGTFWNYRAGATIGYNANSTNFRQRTANPYNSNPGTVFNITPGTRYYATVYNGTKDQRSTNSRSFVAPNCEIPQVTSARAYCDSNSQKVIEVDWSGTGNNYWVDIDTTNPKVLSWFNTNANTSFVRKLANSFRQYSGGEPSTTSGSRLTLNAGSTYYASVYDSSTGRASSNSLAFTAPACCGDDNREGSEQCDNGGSNGSSCTPGAALGATCSYCSNSCTNVTNHSPIGFHDGVDCNRLVGWTCDADNYNQSLAIHVYEGPQGGPRGSLITTGTANVQREVAVGNQCGGNRNHGFDIPLPDSTIDGNIKDIYAFAINPNGGNPLLNNSPRTIDTLTCIDRPTVPNVGVTNDTCGNGISGLAGSIDPSVSNPLEFNIRANEPRGEIKSIEVYFVPKTGNDGKRNGVFENGNTPLRNSVREKVRNSEGIMVTIDPRNQTVYTYNPSGTTISGNTGQDLSTYRGTVTARMSGSSSNPNVNFDIEFGNSFFNGTYSVYYTVINQWNATPANDGTRDVNAIRLTKWGDWGIDMDEPDVLLTDPTFITNSEYQVTRSGGESTAVNQSGIDNSKTRAYLYTPNNNALYQYKPNAGAGAFQNVNLIYQNNSNDSLYTRNPKRDSNINASLTGTFTFNDLRNELEIPVGHALYVTDRACNVGVAIKEIEAKALEPAWLMSVGGSISASEGIDNVEIPNTSLQIPDIYEGSATLSTETVIIGNNVLPEDRVSLRSNILTQYTDEAIEVPGEANFDDWYNHILDRVERNNGGELPTIDEPVVIDEFFSNSALFPDVRGISTVAEDKKNNSSQDDVSFSPVNLEKIQNLDRKDELAFIPNEVLTSNTASFQQYYGDELTGCYRCGSNSCQYIGVFSYFCEADYGLYSNSNLCNSETGYCRNPKPPLHNQFPRTLRCFRPASSSSYNDSFFYSNNCEEGYFAERCPAGWYQDQGVCYSGYYSRHYSGYSTSLYRCTTNPYDGNQCEQYFGSIQDYYNNPQNVFQSLSQCQNSNVCEKRIEFTDCYQCTSTTSDSTSACNRIRVRGSVCPAGWTDQSRCQSGTCPGSTVCYRCTSNVYDSPYTNEPFTITSGTCEQRGGYSSNLQIYSGSARCPYFVRAYRCTSATNDGNNCEAYDVDYYNQYLRNPGAYNLSSNCAAAVGGSCPVSRTCYRCTSSRRDGNTCEAFTVNSNNCPGGTSTSSSGCASAVGGSCPIDSLCYTCTGSFTDGNACKGRWYSGPSCPGGTSTAGNGCAGAVGGTCPLRITCYRCTSSLEDGNNCESFIHTGTSCPAGSTPNNNGCAQVNGGSCPANVTCSRCTDSTTDQGACQNQTFNASNCPSGWTQGRNTCNNCPAQIPCSRCTIPQNDGNTCQNSTFDVSSNNYNCPAGWVNGSNTCGNNCPVEITCYKCTEDKRDQNACESFIYQGSICPSGSTSNPNCSTIHGGTCPSEITCFICETGVTDLSQCNPFNYKAATCPSGTVSGPTSFSQRAPGEVFETVTTCYRCTPDKYDEDACEPFINPGTSCPQGSSRNANGCGSATAEGFCPRPENRDVIRPVVVKNDVSIRSGAVCDQQGIIFVEGNLIIEPDLTTRHNQNGCIFVVKGDVIIKTGESKTNTNIFTNNPADYDIIEGFFIVDGTFRAELDNESGDTFKWDGLMIKGGVYARELDLQRNMNGNGNGNLERPAHLFVHDGRYKKIYENSFGSRFYSIRESLD